MTCTFIAVCRPAQIFDDPGNIVKQAAAMGLEYIAITDHNSAGNVRAALEFARKNGLKLIPAMEVETREEVHLLCYFSSVDALLELEEVVHKHLPDMDNDEELFGYQLLTDHNDEYTAKEERLLALATELSLVQALKLVTNLGGVAVPAHVDRPTNSILGQLGFIPPDERITVIEISRNTDPESFLRRHPQLKDMGLSRDPTAITSRKSAAAGVRNALAWKAWAAYSKQYFEIHP